MSPVKANIDFVLLSANTIESFTKEIKTLSSLINKETIVLLDSCYAPGLDTVASEWLPQNTILCITCEAAVRITEYEHKPVYRHTGDDVITMIGPAALSLLKNTENGFEDLNALKNKVGNFTELLEKNGICTYTFLQEEAKPSMGSNIWKHVISFVCFEILTLIYGELDMRKKNHNTIVTKIFRDVLKLASFECAAEFPSIEDSKNCDNLFYNQAKMFNQAHSQYKIVIKTNSNYYPSENVQIMDPICIYNFANGYDSYVSLCLTQLLKIADSHNIEVPYIESIQTFYYEIEKIDNEKTFNWVKRIVNESPRPQTSPNSDSNTNFINQSEIKVDLPSKRINNPGNNLTVVSDPINGAKTGTFPQPYMDLLASSKMPNGSKNFIQGNANVINEYLDLLAKNEAGYINHPRFKNVPENEINGKKIAYHQMKNILYPSTRGSTAPNDLTLAHKYIYQYANLNNTFESVNNRYGWVDSLSRFKLSSGIKDDEDGSESDEDKNKST